MKEPKGLPFASKVKAMNGARRSASCTPADTTPTSPSSWRRRGADELKDELPGSVESIFQPAEEGFSLYPPGVGPDLGRRS